MAARIHVVSHRITAWEDDPKAGAKPVERPVPDPARGPLAFHIEGSVPKPGLYRCGTPGFRYWTAAEALRRSADFWTAILESMPKLRVAWQRRRPLDVFLDQGCDLNAYYDRNALHFFHDRVGGETVYTGESPDVVCHELGHAVLDAIRPELWDAASDEIAAFHESFGDISAILSALQLSSLRAAVIAETGGRLDRSSRLSRVGEQLGWAIRQHYPDAADPDCLRNAVNAFHYQNPDQLLPSGPAAIVTAEPHSLSRVFTGAFFDALAGIFAASSGAEEDLGKISHDLGRVLVTAVLNAKVAVDYFHQVGAQMLAADLRLHAGRNVPILRNCFVARGILPLAIAEPERHGAVRVRRAAMTQVVLDGGRFGFAAPVRVTVPGERFGIAPAGGGTASSRDTSPAHRFLEGLLRRGSIGKGPGRTHELRESGRVLDLVRCRIAAREEDREAASHSFLARLIARGEAVEPQPGSLPSGVTHELIRSPEETPAARRIRFAARPEVGKLKGE